MIEKLREGIVLDEGTAHFLSSTFSVTSGKELRELGRPEKEDDLELFLDLALSPDDEILEKIESILVEDPPSPSLESEIFDILTDTITGVAFFFPGDNHQAFFDISRGKILRYLTAFRISFVFSPLLSETMKQHLSFAQLVKTRLLLKKFRYSTISDREGFLIRLIEVADTIGEDFPGKIDFAVSLLDGSNSEEDTESLFISRLRSFEKTKGLILSAREMMKKNTMESLMLQGFRVPPESLETVSGNIAMTRRLLSAVFGWVDRGEERISEIDLGFCRGKEDLENMLRLIS